MYNDAVQLRLNHLTNVHDKKELINCISVKFYFQHMNDLVNKIYPQTSIILVKEIFIQQVIIRKL